MSSLPLLRLRDGYQEAEATINATTRGWPRAETPEASS